MERLEKIGRKFNRLPEQVEYDLLSILKWKNNEGEKPDFYGIPYYHKLVELLENMGCIEVEFFEKVITTEGQRLIGQGFVIQDFKTPKEEKQRKIRREVLALWIAFLGLVVGFAGLFLPRSNTFCQYPSELIECHRVIVKDTIDFTSQVDEIAQASDSTSKKDSIKDK